MRTLVCPQRIYEKIAGRKFDYTYQRRGPGGHMVLNKGPRVSRLPNKGGVMVAPRNRARCPCFPGYN